MVRRTGGRRGRLERRGIGLPGTARPVGVSETGGQFKPLGNGDVAAISENVFRILTEIGFADATPHCIEACTGVGAILGNDGRLRMPKQLVEMALQQADKNLVLYGQDPRHDLQIQDQKVHFATAGAAVNIVDTEKNLYRDSTAQDLYDLARLTDTCEHIHLYQRMCVPRDIEDSYAMDLNMLYCSVMGTAKHVGSSWARASHLQQSLQMLHIIAGGEDQWRTRPFVSQASCFVVPPMKFAPEALECLRTGVEGGMPVLLLSAGQAGATSPACLAGAVSQAWAECLGGLVYVNAIKPGAPAILGAWNFVSDLRTGSMTGGSPEQGLLAAAGSQIGQYLGLPYGTACGMSDSKTPDFQAGAERASTALAAALSGANIVYESAGMYASLMAACPESLLLDNDILGAVMRITRGFEVNAETLSFDTIKGVCMGGDGHYLGSAQTYDVMQSEYIYPDFSDRSSPNEWQENNRPVLLERAVDRKNEILDQYVPLHISEETDALLRERFPIYLSRGAMGRGKPPHGFL